MYDDSNKERKCKGDVREMKKTGLIIIVTVLLSSLTACGYLHASETEVPELNTASQSDIESTQEQGGATQDTTSSSSSSNEDTEATVVTFDPSEAIATLDIEEMFTNNELTLTYDAESATAIALSNESVTIDEEGTYILSGTLSDGQIIVEVEDTEKVHLVLDGVNITCSSSAAIYVVDADKVFVTLAEDSTNVLTVSGEYDTADENNVDGVIFSKSDISFLGSGALEINADYGHGIVAKDDLVFMDGTYTITAASHGINANDSIRIADGTFTIVSGKDGIQAENEENPEKGYIYIANGTFDVEAVQDGISSSSMIQVDGGDFNIVSGGGYVEVLNDITVGEGAGNAAKVTDYLEYSMKGMKACNIEINAGDFYISSYEDAIKADYDMTMNGGAIYILSGDDAVHAENILTINEVNLTVEDAYEGIEACYIYINGGTMEVNVYDDAINATESYGMLYVTGGEIFLSCVGDGLDSNGDFTMEGGNIVIDNNPIYSGGDGEVDVSGTVTYTGGTIVDGDGNEIDPTAGLSSGGGQSSFFQKTPSSGSNNGKR